MKNSRDSSPCTSNSSTPDSKNDKAQDMLKVFPQRQNTSSSCSSLGSPSRTSVSSQSIGPATRYALASLATTVLKLDFWNDKEPGSIFFCKSTLQIISQCLEIPDKSVATLKLHLQGEEDLPDIASLITTIKEDDRLIGDGPTDLLAVILVACVSSGSYDSRYRVLLRHLATLLAVVWDEFEEVEDSLAVSLLEQQFVETEHNRKVREKTARNKKIKRYLMIGAAGSVGGVLIGLTGGLAAPLVAASAGMLIGGGTLTVLGTTAGAAILGTTMGVAGAGFTGYKMKKRVGAIEEFQVETLSSGTSLTCTLVVSGWIEENTCPEEAFEYQWRHVRHSKEQYSLRYESEYLMELGNAIEYLMSFAVSVAIQQTLLETALAGIMTAVAWPVALLSVSSILDNPWNVCISRATEVGEQLAEVLLNRAHGKRPITLIGFSLGARVIFHCLLTMAKRAENAGVIEDVILLGAPVTASTKQWEQVCTVVGGRVINGYCETDWLLRFVYRTMSAQMSIAGTGPVDNRKNKKIYNYNLSHIVKGHLDYSRRLTEVLAAVGIRVGPHSDDSAVDLVSLATVASEATEGSVGEADGPLTIDPNSIHELKIQDKSV